MNHCLLLLAAVAVAETAAAESFVSNSEDRARIEKALPSNAFVQPAKPRRLLIFTLNVGYGGHPSMAYANDAFTLMGRKTGAFETVVSNDPKIFEGESLNSFDAVFFNNTVGNCFTNADLRRNLLEFITGGGGLLGVHGTSVAFTRWPGAIEDWPEFGYLIGARGANHKDSDEHVWIKLDDPDNPILQVFGGKGFDYRDEYFRPQGTYSRDRVRVLLSIDTSKTDPNKGQPRGDCCRADNDYALAWIRRYGKGRVFYCTIAHNPYVFWDEKMLRFYLAALQFALGDLPCPTTPSARLSPAVHAQEKLGWRLAWDPAEPRSSTFFQTAEQAAQLGLPYIAGAAMQQVGGDLSKPFNCELADAELTAIRLKLESLGVRLLTYRVAELASDMAAPRRLFEFGRKMGIETFLLEQETAALDHLEKLADEFHINVALQSHGPAGAANLARTCRGRGRHIGMALALSNNARSVTDTIRAAREGRLFSVRLAEPNSPGARRTEQLLTELQPLGAKPVFLIGYGPAAIDSFNATTLKLAAGQHGAPFGNRIGQ